MIIMAGRPALLFVPAGAVLAVSGFNVM